MPPPKKKKKRQYLREKRHKNKKYIYDDKNRGKNPQKPQIKRKSLSDAKRRTKIKSNPQKGM